MRQVRLVPTLALTVLISCESATEVTELDDPLFAGSSYRAVTDSYLVIADGERLPNSIAEAVSAAGGVIAHEIPEIGVAVATSANPTFADSRIAGVTIVPDINIQWIDPNGIESGPAVGAFGNPPASGDDDFFFDLQWGHDAVDAPEAWNAGARGAGVRVAVLDGGIDRDHPDIAPNLNASLSTSFVPGEGPFDLPPTVFSHGTHVSGTVAAADNGFGTIGIAPDAELVMVKVLSATTGRGSFSGILDGIVYAASIDADVINMSLEGIFSRRGEIFDQQGQLIARVSARDVNELLVAVGRATTLAYQSGTTVIAAAGNAGTDGDADTDRVQVPADAPHVISIAATAPEGWAVDPSTNLDRPASYTNFGQSVISFAAPGGDFILPGNDVCNVVLTRSCWVFDLVFSTGNAGWYWSAGTSMAAPHAAGVAAIIIGQNGGSMHPADVEAALRASADDLGTPGNDDFYGAGRVNAGNVIR